AGLPYQGIDVDTDRIATELSLPEAISMTKGCYVGQEVVARTSHRGRPRRQRIVFRFASGGDILPRGTVLRSGAEECGYVTSAAWIPGTGEGGAKGYLTPKALPSNLDTLAGQGAKPPPHRP